MANLRLVYLRIVVEGMQPLDVSVHPEQADAIFEALQCDVDEIVIPFANGVPSPLATEQVRSIEML